MPPAHMRWCVLSGVSGSRRDEKTVNSPGREPAPAIWPILRSRQTAGFYDFRDTYPGKRRQSKSRPDLSLYCSGKQSTRFLKSALDIRLKWENE